LAEDGGRAGALWRSRRQEEEEEEKTIEGRGRGGATTT